MVIRHCLRVEHESDRQTERRTDRSCASKCLAELRCTANNRDGITVTHHLRISVEINLLQVASPAWWQFVVVVVVVVGGKPAGCGAESACRRFWMNWINNAQSTAREWSKPRGLASVARPHCIIESAARARYGSGCGGWTTTTKKTMTPPPLPLLCSAVAEKIYVRAKTPADRNRTHSTVGRSKWSLSRGIALLLLLLLLPQRTEFWKSFRSWKYTLWIVENCVSCIDDCNSS